MVVGSPLDDERKKASFDVKKMTYFLHDGEENYHHIKKINKIVEDDPIFRNDDIYTLDRSSQIKRGFEKGKRFNEQLVKHNLLDPVNIQIFFEAIDMNIPCNLHFGMFIPTIMAQANEEQKSRWLFDIATYKLAGTYAQTELGHGTNVGGIETTATFDVQTDEFVIHSPTITSTKWWPGGLGKQATHCLLMAQLVIAGKSYGVHAFFVPLRNMDTHIPFPGITVGDIGPKMGYQAVDNGYLRFDQYRIPRDHMLMKHSQLSKTGEYSKPPHSKVSYGTMVFVRSYLIIGASTVLSRAATIAIRYSCVRKQGYVIGSDKSGPEMTVMDFGLQQHRLLPLLAGAFALRFTGKSIESLYKKVTGQLAEGNFDQLAEMHATAAALKAFATWVVSDGIEECRKACGGHGYLMVSGLVQLFADYVPSCTYEGDNYVLIQQTARYLFKLCDQIELGGKIGVDSVSYLERKEDQVLGKRENVNWRDSKVQITLLEGRAHRLVWETRAEYQALLKKGRLPEEAWNEIQPLFPRMVNAHCVLYICRCFHQGVYDSAEEYPGLQEVLKRLADFYVLYQLEKDMLDFVETGVISRSNQKKIRQLKKTLMELIRPDAVPLVDSFDHSDHRLNSALGRYDGNVYEALLESTKKEPLNQSHLPPGYHEFLKPMMKSSNPPSKL